MATVNDFRASEFEVLGGPIGPVEVGATGLRAIYQNVQTILATIKGTVPLDRTFGINADLVDTPMPLAQSRLTGEVVAAIERWEPRVKVVSVSFVNPGQTETADGRLIPRVRLRINGAS